MKVTSLQEVVSTVEPFSLGGDVPEYAIHDLRAFISSVDKRLYEAKELHELAVEFKDEAEIKKYEKEISRALRDMEALNHVLRSAGAEN